MNFLAPSLLLGGLAIGIPIVLHFFYKARYRPLPWAAMKFLKQAIEQTSRRLKFQELLLLALRCLVLLLLAFALARPALKSISAGGRGESIDAIFVFDTSYSMGARDGEVTRIERAKEAALRIIDDLPPNSTVQIFACSDRVTPLGPVSPGNLDQARQVVQGIELTSQSGEMLPGLNEAYAALDRGAGANKEVYLFTDLQKSGWESQAGALKARANEIKQRATLLVVRCGNPERPVNNVEIADMTIPAGIPHTGSRLPVTILLKNTGKNPVRNLSVTLDVDGRAQEKETANVDEVAGGQTFPVTLTAKLDQAGPRLLTARVTADDVPGDNQLDRIIPVRDQIRVLIVDGAPDPRDPKLSASHFLRNALLPVPANQLDEYFVKVTVVPPEEAGPGLLGVNDLCILCNVASSNTDRPGIMGLSPEFVNRLGSFVKDGGGLMIGLGDNIIPARYNAVLGSAGNGVLPFDLDEPISTTAEEPFSPAPDSTAPGTFLSRFRDGPFRTETAEVDIIKLIGLRDNETTGGQVLMRLTNQKPWIAHRTHGEGEVVLVTTSFDGSWTNWPARGGSYLSFVQITLSHLTSRSSRGTNKKAGDQLVWYPPEATRSFDLLRPDRKRVKLGKAEGGDSGKRVTVVANDTPLAGVYQMGYEGEEPLSGPHFAVTPDLRDSDNLESLTDTEAEDLLGFKPVMVLAGAGEDALTAERSKRELTIWVLLILFFVAVGEAGWAWFCGKAW